MKTNHELKSNAWSQDQQRLGKKGYLIIINGQEKMVEDESLTFEQIVRLEYGKCMNGETISLTITYEKGGGRKSEGTLVEGETVKIKNGTIFNVAETNRS